MNPKVKRHEELVKKYAGKKMPDDIDVYEGFTSRAQTANLEQQIKSKKFSTYLTKVGQGWRVYPIEAGRIPQNANGILNPSAYGGLEYEVLEFKENGNVAIIQTQMFGKVQIWIGPDTRPLRSLTVRGPKIIKI